MSRWFLALAVVIGVAVGVLGMVTWDRRGPGADRARIEGVVRDYVLAHPELIPEAMQRLQDREAGRTIAANRDLIETPFGSAWAGNPKGDVSVVEYFDYNCGYCRASLPIVAQLIAADPKVRIVYRDYPVLSEASATAARLSLAAAEAGRFKPFHDALYAGGPLTDAGMAAAARSAGLDPAQLAKAAQGREVETQVRTNLAMGRALGMAGTPAWVIGDQVFSGLQSLDALKAAVAAARKGA